MVKQTNKHTHPGKSGGMEKKAIRWMLDAEADGYDAIVLLVDEDGFPDRVDQIDRAQQSGVCNIRRAAGVAVRTFDAWMLADEKALSRVLGSTINRLSDPEQTRDPKRACAGLLTNSRVNL